MTMQTIPVASLKDFESRDPARRAAFVQTVGEAMVDIGFFALADHGVDSDLITKAYGAAEAFFKLSDDAKKSYEDLTLKGQRGYTSFGREHAKDAFAPDLKEFWHVGQDYPPGHPLASVYPPNLWPAEVPEFRDTFVELYGQLERCAMQLLEACATYIGEPENRFTSVARDGNTILRVIHYPPIAADAHPASIRAAAHEDINFITLLCEATASGLELKDRTGAWRAIQALKGQIIVDAGDMLQNMTNGFYKSTTHRVVNPDNSRERRFSMPFFVHPRGEASLAPLPSCVARTGGKVLFRNISAGAYLEERLREIGLTKK